MNEFNETHREIVEAGGGVYRAGMFVNLVLFDSPETHSTLALPEDSLTAEAVRAHIQASNVKFGIFKGGTPMMAASYATKKELKENIGKPLRYVETSAFAPEYKENGSFCVVGPSPTTRKWFATVTM